MLVGCIIRNFKVYENIAFVPISKGKDGNFSVFTGNNGVGKSSVLEALNNFFHQFNHLEVNQTYKYTGYSNELKSIKGKDVDGYERKHEIIDFISSHDIKYQVAVEYTQIYEERSFPAPEWIQKIFYLFK